MPKIFGVRPQLLIILVAAILCAPTLIVMNYPVGGKVIIGSKPWVRPFTFPHGGRQLLPRYRLVALYGTPDTPALGALGEQDAEASITRVKGIASAYQALSTEYILPTLEIITTVASATPTDDGDYSYPVDHSIIQQWITAAGMAGVYVVVDLQPGRSSFLAQAKQLEGLLMEPNVGLALDPEWRLKPDQVHLQQIGSVDISEVNQTSSWLAGLTRQHHLPQKLFLLHQFRSDMLRNREQLDTSHSELAYIIQMDGQGSQEAKLDTWRAIVANPPTNVQFGWKNFYKKDTVLRSPADTMGVQPGPWYVSYQ